MKNLAVIAARSGSKSLKDKNIKELRGKPMMAYTIEAALDSGCFSCIHLSTDSTIYADIGRSYGCDIPFLRNSELANDTAGSWDVVRFVVREYEKLGKSFDTVTLLQPTSPLRGSDDIKGAFARMEEKRAEAVVSVCEMEHSPLGSNTLPEDLCMDDFEDERLESMTRQQLPVYYRMNGAIYITTTAHLMEGCNMYRKNCYAYIMPQKRSIDVDNALDFQLAEILMEEII